MVIIVDISLKYVSILFQVLLNYGNSKNAVHDATKNDNMLLEAKSFPTLVTWPAVNGRC